VRRDAARLPANYRLTTPDRIDLAMDRSLARKNIRSGLIVGAVCLFMFGMTFVAALIYTS